MKFMVSENQKFLLSIILTICGIFGIDYLVYYVTKTIHVVSWINQLIILRYSGIILLILLMAIIYIIRKQITISKKMGLLDLETINIVSDEQTIFAGSNTNRALPSNVRSVEAWKHPAWEQADFMYPQLEDAIWLADRKNITNEEAIRGGQYTFYRDFEISFDLKNLRLAVIFLLVDDFCELMINETRFPKVGGYTKLHKFDISKAIKNGKNKIQFVIENISFEHLNKPEGHEGFYVSDTKFFFNPYGFKYRLIMQFIK